MVARERNITKEYVIEGEKRTRGRKYARRTCALGMRKYAIRIVKYHMMVTGNLKFMNSVGYSSLSFPTPLKNL